MLRYKNTSKLFVVAMVVGAGYAMKRWKEEKVREGNFGPTN